MEKCSYTANEFHWPVFSVVGSGRGYDLSQKRRKLCVFFRKIESLIKHKTRRLLAGGNVSTDSLTFCEITLVGTIVGWWSSAGLFWVKSLSFLGEKANHLSPLTIPPHHFYANEISSRRSLFLRFFLKNKEGWYDFIRRKSRRWLERLFSNFQCREWWLLYALHQSAVAF